MKYIKVSRSDMPGSYTDTLKGAANCVEGEFDGIEGVPVGTSITLTVVEMSEEEYAKLPEFDGW
ncbi:MAG: hypothetical protein WC935_00145 [Thermoleophilia bacterium]